jgi:hypothetical protein
MLRKDHWIFRLGRVIAKVSVVFLLNKTTVRVIMIKEIKAMITKLKRKVQTSSFKKAQTAIVRSGPQDLYN